LAPIWAKTKLGCLAELFGGGESGLEVAAFVLEVQGDLPLGSLTGKNRSQTVQPNQTQSKPIQPDQTN
ncbi:MAG TPA: hypothetical protein VGK40_12300, partial [Verrucomicrobiae bacterium]